MATFPALTPSSRSFTPGLHSHSEISTLNGLQARVRTSNVVLEQRLRLTFLALTEAQMLSIRTHYLGQQGRFLSFVIPNDLLSGMSTPASFTPTGHSWIYAAQPQVTDVACGRHDVSVDLVTVPPEGANINGAEFSLGISIAAGVATSTVNNTGFDLTVTGSLEPGLYSGDVEFAASGAQATVVATFQGGVAEGTVVESQSAMLFYSGTGSAQSITGAGFEPGFVALKRRDATANHGWYDVARGTGNYVPAGQTAAEQTLSTGLTSFDGDGFSLGTSSVFNASSGDYLAFALPTGGGAGSNTDGSVTTTISAQNSSEASFFTYVGSGNTNHTIGHGLSGTPDLVIVKQRSVTTAPYVGGPLIGDNYYFSLGSNSATAINNTTVFRGFGATTVSVGATLQGNGANYRGWAFKAKSGTSNIGEFTGAGSATHAVTLGYQPKMLILKNTSTTASDWLLCYRPAGGTGYVNTVALNSNALEATSTTVQFNSDGFSVDVGGPGNVSGGTTKALYWAML